MVVKIGFLVKKLVEVLLSIISEMHVLKCHISGGWSPGKLSKKQINNKQAIYYFSGIQAPGLHTIQY